MQLPDIFPLKLNETLALTQVTYHGPGIQQNQEEEWPQQFVNSCNDHTIVVFSLLLEMAAVVAVDRDHKSNGLDLGKPLTGRPS